MTAIMFIGLTIITMMGVDNNGILIHSPVAIRVCVHLKHNWTPTLTNLRQRMDMKNWTSSWCHAALSLSNWEEAGKGKTGIFTRQWYCGQSPPDVSLPSPPYICNVKLKFFSVDATKSYRGRKPIAPVILNVDKICMSVVEMKS